MATFGRVPTLIVLLSLALVRKVPAAALVILVISGLQTIIYAILHRLVVAVVFPRRAIAPLATTLSRLRSQTLPGPALSVNLVASAPEAQPVLNLTLIAYLIQEGLQPSQALLMVTLVKQPVTPATLVFTSMVAAAQDV
jgi:hypothetical protein